jgi:hypothetical protein
MKKLLFCIVAGLIMLFCGSAFAQTATQTVTFQVTAIDEISVSGDPGALIVNSATAGSQPDAATDATTSYAVTTNGSSKKVTGEIDSAMPANTTLAVTLTAPSGGSSAGQVTLTTSAADLVTGISTLAESGMTISYNFSATAAAGVVASDTRTVTLTLTDGS